MLKRARESQISGSRGRVAPSLKLASASAGFVLLQLVVQACTGNPQFVTTPTANPISSQNQASSTAMGARVSFRWNDYYTLTAPNPNTNCAGDARIYYDPIAQMNPGLPAPTGGYWGFGISGLSGVTGGGALAAATVMGSTAATGAIPFPRDQLDGTHTIRPSFIKNISVDLTDSNVSTGSNLAFACSLGNGPNVPPVSSCATFDYGAIGGIPTTMGGTLLLIGGVNGYNYSGILPSTAQTQFPYQGLSVACGPELSATQLSAPTGYNMCPQGMYALGVNTLPGTIVDIDPSQVPGLIGTTAGTSAVSTWANISGTSGYSGPRGAAGSAAAYDPGTQQLIIFGGAAPLAGFTAGGNGAATYDTWTYDLKKQKWSYLNSVVYVDTLLESLFDQQIDSNNAFVQYLQLAKPVGARSLMGYVATPGMALTLDRARHAWNSTTNLPVSVVGGDIDATDRIVSVGGLSTVGVIPFTNRFNPTFGPELMDASSLAFNLVNVPGPSGVPNPYSGTYPMEPYPRVWMDSYHTQLLNNSFGYLEQYNSAAAPHSSYPGNDTYQPSVYMPDYPPLVQNSTDKPNFGQNQSVVPLVHTGAGGGGVQGTGYLLAAGGFDSALVASTGVVASTGPLYQCNISGGNGSIECGGSAMLMTRRADQLVLDIHAVETVAGNFGMVTNLTDPFTTEAYPVAWTQLKEPGSPDPGAPGPSGPYQTVPWYGGAGMARGFNVKNNEVVYFGGADCKNYLGDISAPCVFGSTGTTGSSNQGRYWSFGTDPAGSATIPNDTVPAASRYANGLWAGAPTKAGMAVARGLDPTGHVIIVAWGGMTTNTIPDSNGTISYLFLSGATPTWANLTPTGYQIGGAAPITGLIGGTQQPVQGNSNIAPLTNAQLVFSHVTRKFYLFGGYSPSSGSMGDTFELSVHSTDNNACNGTNCYFAWRQLDVPGGLTCYPGCPPARRSHRMTEVNYFNRNPGGLGASTNGEQDCPANAPCSYGIFMEGGTPDGMSFLGDRWMFDPTANGGLGHWQQVNDFPPRTLPALATMDYFISSKNAVVHRALMFGGETGMANPVMAATGVYSPISNTATTNTFISPTLGDTWMYDFDNNTWNRVTLLGKGYNLGGAGGAFAYNTLNNKTLFQNEFERRQAFDITGLYGAASPGPGNIAWPGMLLADQPELAELSPPPLSGGFMVTRPSPHKFVTPQSPGGIPEIYLFGGRLKDGSFNTLDHVYKFCAGSTGEMFDWPAVPPASGNISTPSSNDYGCDSYDSVFNPSSPSPVNGYVGRWLRKNPQGSNMPSNQRAAFMGAGAYDATRDTIVVFGGLRPINGGTIATDLANVATSAEVYEYKPPTAPGSREGTWSFVQSCTPTAPAGRFAHSLGYDPLNEQIILVGGYDANGNPLVTNLTYPLDGRQYSIPEVWVGKYYGANYNPPAGSSDIPVTNAPCYLWSKITVFGNSIDIPSQAPPTGGLAHAASVFIPSSGYNTGYYSMFDSACEKAGPIATSDPNVNKLLAGGAYIDIDRSVLGPNENLLLNLTYIPLGTNNVAPNASPFTAAQAAMFNIHLVKTGISGDGLRAALQPRYLQYSAVDQFPQVVQTLTVMAPPTGEIRQDQVILPISIDPSIDRIRIERYSGSAILIEANIFRMGYK